MSTSTVFDGAQRTLYANRIICLFTDIDNDIAELVVTQLLALSLEDETKPITLMINSVGGEMPAAFSIHDTMKSIKCPVYTVANGCAMSSAALILAAGEKGNRSAYENSEIMIHEVSAEFGGKVSDSVVDAQQLIKSNNRMIKLLSGYTGKREAKIKTDLQKDYYLEVNEAMKYGLIDYIVPSKGIAGKTTKKVVGVVKAVKSVKEG